MEENFSRIIESCDSCNISCDPWNVRQYEILYEGSKIHDQNKITLCYVCSKIAKNAQQFISNVQRNSEMKQAAEKIKKSIINLSVSVMETIELSGSNTCDVDSCYTIISAINGNLLTESRQTNVKVEDCTNEQGIYDDTCCDGDLDYTIVKQECFDDEDNSPLKELLNSDVDLKKEVKKKKRVKYNSGKRKAHSILNDIKEEQPSNDKNTRISTVYLTLDEYLQEKTEKSNNERYLNAQYKCADCVLAFCHKLSYLKHMEKHGESAGQFVCELCKQHVNTREKLKHHLKMHKIRYKCNQCNLIRNQAGTIREHIYAVHMIGKRPRAECDKCDRVYKRYSSLRKHIIVKHTPRKRVTCIYCQKSYSSSETLKNHMILKHPEEVAPVKRENKYICQDCGAAFRSPAFLKSHRLKHSDRRDFYCVECDKGFKSETGLKTHLKTTTTHRNYLDLPLACTQCEKRFSIKRDIERHMNSVHLNIRPHQCDQCTKAYCNLWSLKEHQKITHEGYKRPLIYQCEFCDKAFARKQILKAHKRTHTGERPYQCDKCQATFNQSSTLATHNRLRRQILKAHKRTHTGERPYQCDKCQAAFNQSSTLATHNRLVHLRLTRSGKNK